jgi:hypothetical protein
MRRRELLAILGGAAALPLAYSNHAARAQPADQARRVAVLLAEAIEDDPEYEGRISAFAAALRDLGWIEGQNLKLFIHRAKPGYADIRKGVAELLAENPEIIVAGGGTTTPPRAAGDQQDPRCFRNRH